MVSKLATMFLFVGLAFGQRADTVYYQVATNTANNSFQTDIPAANNIGQPYHILYVDFFDAPGKTCNSPVDAATFTPPVADILGGDGLSQSVITNYTRIIQPQSGGVGNKYRMVSSAAGAFPFLSVAVNNWDNVNCRANIFYSGSLSSIDIKKYADFGSTSDPLRTLTISVTAGDNLIISQPCLSCRIVVYSLILFNQTSQTVILQDVRKDAGVVNLMTFTSWATGAQVALPNTNFPVFSTSVGGSLNIHLTGATTVSGMVSFRVE